MIRTKQSKKLTQSDQKHLTQMGISSLRAFIEMRNAQREYCEKYGDVEACYICRGIAKKLNLEE